MGKSGLTCGLGHSFTMSANTKIIPVVLAGGEGHRLWPLSNEATPKQFLKLGSTSTLFQQALNRCTGAMFDATPIVIAAQNCRGHVLQAAEELNQEVDIILEPLSRNSCAAMVAGALRAMETNPRAILLVLAADHNIPDVQLFQASVLQALPAAQAGKIVAFGIVPSHPATGYGYIQTGNDLPDAGVKLVNCFAEKPNLEMAQTYVDQGYLWNSGNFLLAAQVLVDEVERLAPEVLHAVRQSLDEAERDADFIRLGHEPFSKSPSLSFDCAVMEKTKRASVLPVDYAWSDVGNWDVVSRMFPTDQNGNAIVGRGIVNSSNNVLVHAHEVPTAVIGCKDIIVVTTRDAVLVVQKNASEDVKALVAQLKSANLNGSSSPPK